jgi:hypothetical protein
VVLTLIALPCRPKLELGHVVPCLEVDTRKFKTPYMPTSSESSIHSLQSPPAGLDPPAIELQDVAGGRPAPRCRLDDSLWQSPSNGAATHRLSSSSFTGRMFFLDKPCTVDGRRTDSVAESCWAANQEECLFLGVAKTRTTGEGAQLVPFVDGSAGDAFHRCH